MNMHLMEFFSRDNVQDKINDEAFAINLDEYSDIELNGLLCMHWIIILLTLTVLV